MKWEPFEKQRIALSCPAFELFYGGARGGGKSDYLLIDYLDGIKYGEEYSGVLFRRTYPELEEIIKRSKVLYRSLGSYKIDTRTWTFGEGATLKLRYLDKDDDTLNYIGHSYAWIGFDELTSFPTDAQYTFMFGCARSAKGIPVRIRSTGNPGTIGHKWVRARFVDPAPPGTIFKQIDTGLDCVYIPSTLDDNTFMMENDPTYEHRLKAMGGDLYRAMRYGDWDVVAGAALSEFRANIHMVDPYKIEKNWKKFCVMDWGYARPYSIGWYAINDYGQLVRFSEMYGSSKPDVGVRQPADKVAKEAWQVSCLYGVNIMYADPSIWNKQGHVGGSISDSFSAAGFKLRKAYNDRMQGLQLVRNVLNGWIGELPAFQLFRPGKAFVRTIPTLPPDRNNPEDVDTDAEDHVYDEFRYACFAALREKPSNRKIIMRKKEYNPLYFDG